MMIMRPAKQTDLEMLLDLANSIGPGVTSFAPNRDYLQAVVTHSITSFSKDIAKPDDEYYLFVLEELSKHTIAGVSAIRSTVGVQSPNYFYHIKTQEKVSKQLNVSIQYQKLNLENAFQGVSELCTLALARVYRGSGVGSWLSRGRLLFMAEFPNRFSETLIAEMRGVSDEQGHSPFWSSVCAPFVPLSFSEADELTLVSNKQFIEELMPKSELFVPLLPAHAQQVIGQPHPHTQLAMNMLLDEGFVKTEYVDIFDAGPTLQASLSELKTIQESVRVTIEDIKPIKDGKLTLCMTVNFDNPILWCAPVQWISDNKIAIEVSIADDLALFVGQDLRVVKWH